VHLIDVKLVLDLNSGQSSLVGEQRDLVSKAFGISAMD